MRLQLPPSTRVLVATAVAAVFAACEQGPSDLGPANRVRGFRPSFSIAPGSPPIETDSGRGSCYDFDDSHVTLSVRFYAPNVTPGQGPARAQCGDLAFDEDSIDGPFGSVVLTTAPGTAAGGYYQTWWRGWRHWQTGTFDEDSVTTVPWTDSSKTSPPFDAPASGQFDVTIFAYRDAPTYASALNRNTPVDGAAQLWRHLDSATSFQLTTLPGRLVHLTWVNHHRNRTVDSTLVWRRKSGEEWVPIHWARYDSTGYTDDPGFGTWYYMIQHVSRPATSHYHAYDAPAISRNNSGTTSQRTVAIDSPPAAPTNLHCEGNFDPTMDCAWTNADSSDSTEIYRNGALRDTVGPGVTSWTDQVTSGSTYVYKVRHLENDTSSAFSSPDTTVARPVAPSGLSCAGTGDTEVTCIWANEENDTIEVWRRVGNHGPYDAYAVVSPVQYTYLDSPVETGETYWYKLRYRRGADTTDFSNADDAHPGEDDPLRPPGPPAVADAELAFITGSDINEAMKAWARGGNVRTSRESALVHSNRGWSLGAEVGASSPNLFQPVYGRGDGHTELGNTDLARPPEPDSMRTVEP